MKEFFQWATSSSIATAVLLIVFCILVAAVIGIYITAFIQGREISFWPPKVGAEPLEAVSGGSNAESEMTSGAITRFPIQTEDVLTGSSGSTYTIASYFYGGSTTTLFKAKTEEDDQVIVKVYWRGLRPNSSPWEHFQREHRAAEILSHRNIARVFDRGIDGYPFIVMEYLSGGTLRGLIDTRDTIPGSTILSISEQVANAIDFAHSNGVIHRDVKPENILLEADARDRVVLSDFGVAKILGAVEQRMTTASNEFYGAASYLSPETICDGEITKSSDIYSFAVVLFEMISGHTPFNEINDTYSILHAKIEKNAPNIKKYRAVPNELAERLEQALSRDVTLRPESARDVLVGLENTIQEL